MIKCVVTVRYGDGEVFEMNHRNTAPINAMSVAQSDFKKETGLNISDVANEITLTFNRKED